VAQDGLVIFMKGPRCDAEIAAASGRFEKHYRLWCDLPYRIPNTAHQRRLVVFQRIDEPIWARQQRAMERHTVRRIESAQNELFKDLKKLLASRGIKKQQRALVSGKKQVLETLHDFPERCEAWISLSEDAPPPGDAPEQLLWYQLAPPLFEMLDVLGTHAPLLVIGIPEIAEWDEAAGFPRGCTLLLPFQDPENVGAVIRSAVAFGVTQVVLLAESAHPYHPRAWRASGGTVLRVRLLEGPALADLPPDLPVVALSAQGQDVGQFDFPDSFALLPGIEGPGLPEAFRARTVGIPMREGVESLNAATATAIALYVWSRRQSAGSAEKTDP
jgi:16S rRNA (guanine527-N7)-methyltransferase